MPGKSHRQKQPAYREVGRRVPPPGVPILFIWLRDVISIKSHAFNGDITKELYAPKASMIESMAFKECYSLRTVLFGALRLVGENPFYECDTEWGLQLNLSSEQAELKFDKTAQKWIPTEQSYWNTDDSRYKKFLGLTFMDIRESGY